MLSLRLLRPTPRLLLRHLSTLPEHKQIIMPKVSPTMTAGRLVTWKKREGEFFEEGEDIAEVESDKATMPISAREDGYVARILIAEDTADIPLGTVLAVTVEEPEWLPEFENYTPPSDDAPTKLKEAVMEEGAKRGEGGDVSGGGEGDARVGGTYEGPIGPAVMRLVREFPGLDLGRVKPTGKKGRVLKGDVLLAIEEGTAFAEGVETAVGEEVRGGGDGVEVEVEVLAGGEGEGEVEFEDVAVSSMRRAIARRLVASKMGVPHRYMTRKYVLDAVLGMRKRVNGMELGVKVSVNDIMLKGIGAALRRVPEMNVRWVEGEGVVGNESVDVSMAVAVDGGLITPIVKGVDGLGLAEVARVSKELVRKAREGVLEPEEYEGGGFCLSNLGMFGVDRFAAIVNPPQSGILAVGTGVATAVMGEDGKLRKVVEGTATLSSDARSVDDATAAKFLQEFAKCMSDPESMLL